MLGKRSILPIIIAIVAYYYYNNIYSKCQKPNSPIIKITTGDIQGIISKSREGREFYEYLGIPYAQPPINELRYEPPEPPKHWSGIREANQLSAECAQLNIIVGGKSVGDEDCLFLNVFTPNLKNDGKLYPTMVWIHGGLFVSGSSNMYRPDFFMDEDIVLVTINYRLAALGFLNTGDGVVLGNMGLKDQSMALQWVQQNIKNFGGDPSQVTIFGESAGGASVHFQMLSKMSEGLFHRAISQSGVALCPWSIRSDVATQAERHAKTLNCPTGNMKKMVECLKKKPVNEILEAHRESMPAFRDPITIFGPTVEVIKKNAFISEHPRDIIRKGKGNHVPWMTGINSHEGLLTSPVIARDEKTMQNFDQNFNKLMPNFIFYSEENGRSVDSDMNKIRDFYFGKEERIDKIEKMENFTNLITDYVWAVGLEESVKLHSESTPVYLYYYTYNGQFALSEFLMAMKGKYPPILEISWFLIKKWVNAKFFNIHIPHYGPCHGDEMALEFTLTGLADVRQGHPDYDLSRKMVTLWASFAKYTNPLNTLGPVWLPQNPKSKEFKYLKIDNIAEIISQPNAERMAFWNQLRS